jgi:hypothetical protein
MSIQDADRDHIAGVQQSGSAVGTIQDPSRGGLAKTTVPLRRTRAPDLVATLDFGA